MIIRADVKCYYCGHVSGQVEGDPTNPDTRWNFLPTREQPRQTGPTRHAIRCIRCGGPVFLDEIEAVRPRRHPVASATN